LSSYIASLALGYLIGSFPSAFMLVSWQKRVDIRKAGSGNVGAMNTYDITGSRALGTLVMVIDVLKGMAALWLSSLFFGRDFFTMGLGGIGAVLGHDFPVWLNFRGGRGLSTTAGVMLIAGWLFVAVWCLVWTAAYILPRNIHKASIAASVLTPLVLFLIPAGITGGTLPPFIHRGEFLYLAVVLNLLIIIRHADHVRDFFKPHQT